MAPANVSQISGSVWLKSFLAALDLKAPEQRSGENANGVIIPCSSVPQHWIPLRQIQLTTTLSFRSVHNTHSLAHNFYRRRHFPFRILNLPSSSMLLLLHAQELPLEQHPARDNKDRHRANNRDHAPRSRLVARIEDAFAGDS